MKTALYTIAIVILLFCSHPAFAQIDSTLLNSPARADTAKHALSMDAMYNRPFLKAGKFPVSIGGYMESDYQYVSTSGISSGNQFQFRRFSLFVASTISKHIKFLSEIEYENDPTGDPVTVNEVGNDGSERAGDSLGPDAVAIKESGGVGDDTPDGVSSVAAPEPSVLTTVLMIFADLRATVFGGPYLAPSP